MRGINSHTGCFSGLSTFIISFSQANQTLIPCSLHLSPSQPKNLMRGTRESPRACDRYSWIKRVLGGHHNTPHSTPRPYTSLRREELLSKCRSSPNASSDSPVMAGLGCVVKLAMPGLRRAPQAEIVMPSISGLSNVYIELLIQT
jgi:hypothetical protein